MAALLSEKLGRTISVTGFKAVRSRKDAPAEWLESLGIAPQEPTYTADVPPDDPPDLNAGRQNPPPTAPVAGVLPFEPATAEMQLTLIYTMAGKGAAIALRSPEVADVWAQHAPQIAAAYIEWARYSPRVAQYIAAITLGGPAGQIVLLHGSLLITTLIVSGRVRPDQFIPPMGDATDTINEPTTTPPDPEPVYGSEPDAAPPRKRTRARRDSAVRGVE
jgi:hypothetical protein